jgi:iron complex transport system ATP-binding protein
LFAEVGWRGEGGGGHEVLALVLGEVRLPRILLDEPINHLDLAFQALVMTLLRSLGDDGFTVVAILHDPNVATLYADRLVCLSGGRVFADSGYGGSLTPDTLETVYGMRLVPLAYKGKTLVLHG